MTPEANRSFNTKAGVLSIVLGIFCWSATAYYTIVPNPPKPVSTGKDVVLDIPSCRATLSALGYKVKEASKLIVVQDLGPIRDPEEQLKMATIAQTVCKLQMESFCMGENCKEEGVTMMLRKPE